MVTPKNVYRLVLILSLVFIFSYRETKALGLVFPFQRGNVYVTNGYEGAETHQGKSKFSLDFRSYHKNNPCLSYGAPVLAAESGQIIFIHEEKKRKGKGYGNHMILKTLDGRKMWYAHMIRNSIFVQGPTDENKNIIGDFVQQGQILGLLGDTGNTQGMVCNAFDGTNSGAHLHFEMRNKDGTAFKPEPMVGEKSYANISKAGNPYISTTVMLDPGRFWDIWKEKVPYQLLIPPIKIAEVQDTVSDIKNGGSDAEGILEFLWRFSSRIFSRIFRQEAWTNEKAFEYVMSADGEYSDSFLNWVGWEKRTNAFEVYDHALNGMKELFEIIKGKYAMKWVKISSYAMNHKMSLLSDILPEDESVFHDQRPLDVYLDNFFSQFNKNYSTWYDFKSHLNALNAFDEKYDRLLSISNNNRLTVSQINQPSQKDKDLAAQVGLQYIDFGYDLFAPPMRGSDENVKYTLDFVTCPIPEGHSSTVERLLSRENYKNRMKEIWHSALSPVMKFYAQQKIYESLQTALYFKKIFKKNKFSCFNFLIQSSQLLDEVYSKIPLQDLQDIYDEVVAD